MPCTCAGYPAPEPDKHTGPLADMLCKTLQEHEAREEMGCFDAETLKWWKEHKERDKKRLEIDLKMIKNKAERKAALAKLTPHERKLLGL